VTAYYSHPAFDLYVTPPGHPERVDRLVAVRAALDGLPLDRRDAPLATDAQIARCHPQRYIDRLKSAAPDAGFRGVDPDTWLSPGSLEAAFRAAGGCIAAVDAVMAGEVPNAFVAGRPPGHHAETETAMGFCLFGNVAIAALHAIEAHGLSRVAVVDFDVHHGNGTQDLLWSETRTLFCSTHQMPLYPGTGARAERGAHGNVVNVPLAPGTGGTEMRRAYEGEVFPALEAFRPEMILVSAGFDAHRDDPLASLNWTEDDFAWLSAELVRLAGSLCGGRLVSTLEGGYDLAALGASVRAHVEALRNAP